MKRTITTITYARTYYCLLARQKGNGQALGKVPSRWQAPIDPWKKRRKCRELFDGNFAADPQSAIHLQHFEIFLVTSLEDADEELRNMSLEDKRLRVEKVVKDKIKTVLMPNTLICRRLRKQH